MPYTQEISRTHPSCMLFMIDQSASMTDPVGAGAGTRKSQAVADAVNRLLADLVIKCTKGEGVRHYFDVGVVGYGSDNEGIPRVGPAFGGSLAGQGLVSILDVESNPARIEERHKREPDGAGGLVETSKKFPVWFYPVAQGNTPMCEAFRQATLLLNEWTGQHKDSYPPVVINITDGESTDGDPTSQAQALAELTTDDGDVLLFNIHVSSREGEAVTFPDTDASLPDEYARLLFSISSPLPEGIRNAAASEGYSIGANPRGFAFNADLVELIRFLDIGTRGANLR